MSLDVYLTLPACEHCGRGETQVYSANITHNLNAMAEAAGIYRELWRPDDLEAGSAGDIIPALRRGLEWLRANETEARKHDAPNGWGMYEHFVPFVEQYLAACETNPRAKVSVWR